MPTTSSAVRRPRRAHLLAAACAAFLTPCLLLPSAAAAPTATAPKATAPKATVAGDKDEKPEPPTRMSTIGGADLGRPGTQVDPRPGADAPGLPEKLSARAWIVADAESGQVLASHNAHWQLAPASTLKMLFADTLLPEFGKEETHKVARSDLEGMGEGSSLVGIKEGLTYTVEDLWRGVFLRSGNDAVHVLAAMNGGVDKTVREMNAHAKELRALDTHAVSPDGYDKPGQVSSAYDLTLIARSGMQKKDFRDYASTVRADFPGGWKKAKDGEKKKRKHFEIQNTNRLLTGDYGLDPYEGIAGVKNGYTTNAGNTFTGVAERDGRVLLVTMMHPEKDGHLEVYKETAKLFDWGFKAADTVRPVGRLVAPGSRQQDEGGETDAENPGGSQDPSSMVSAGAKGQESSGGGAAVALGLTGASLVLLALVVYLVHRRWPMALPDLSRLRGRSGD